MTNFFRGNTQPSTLQQTIEKITDGNQSSEDWSTIMSLCDFVNTHDERFVCLRIFRCKIELMSIELVQKK